MTFDEEDVTNHVLLAHAVDLMMGLRCLRG